MTDDLVKRLRWLGDHASFDPHMYHKAADRIEQLELIEKAYEQNQKTWSRNIARIETLETARDGAYTERNRLVAFLASIYPSGVKKTAIPGWDAAWHNCVYIDLPVGQASWHYHNDEAHLFAHLPPYDGEWDGHTTEEKYERLFLASSHAKQTDELLADYIKFSDELMPHTKKQADRIEKLEAALTHIYAWYPISTFNPHQTIKEIKEFAHKALEGKDD